MVRLSRALVTFAFLVTSALAVAIDQKTTTTPFDGQYIHPNDSNTAVEWWWGQAIGEPVGNNPPPSFQFLFYQGYPIQIGPKTPAQPEYYIVINGFFSNGTDFALTIPAGSGTVTATGNGEGISGQWGSVGFFQDSPDLSTFTVQFSARDAGLEGAVTIKSNAAHHFACNTTSTPYFSSAIPEGATLTTQEDILFNQLGWAVTTPGGTAQVSVVVDGTPLVFSGLGYHDANWAPVPLNDIVSTWYFGSGQAGPYDFNYVFAQPTDGTKALNTGYLSRNGVVLQNQCSVDGAKSNDHSVVTGYGSTTQAGVLVPTGYIIDYVLEDGETYSFNLSAAGTNPDQNIYHRWVGSAVGGKKGENFEGLSVFEWLNPGFLAYTPPN